MWVSLLLNLVLVCNCHGLTTSTIHIFEELPPGSILANAADIFETADFDSKFKLLECKIISFDDVLKFQSTNINDRALIKVDEISGEIVLTKQIDRDEVCYKATKCSLRAQIIRLPDQQLAEVIFVISDINDNVPIFPTNKVEIAVEENMAVGDYMGLDSYMARDADSSFNGEITYSLSTNQYFEVMQRKDSEGLFHLDLVCLLPIDYEETKSIELLLIVRDGGVPSMTSQMILNIVVKDTNDNEPIFHSKKYIVSLRENSLPGHEVVTVEADDADSGVFGQIQYYLSQRNNPHVTRLVTIDRQSGVVALKEKLDRERDDGIRIRIEARDSSTSGQKVGETYVIINIEDVNDNAPIIFVNYVVASEMNTAFVKENSDIGTYIARVTTVDADNGNNGDVDVTISSETSHDLQQHSYFALSERGFIETTINLDREVNDKYIVTITACDKGDVPKCSQKRLNVVVLDVNEFSPIFDIPNQIISLYENVIIGNEVATVRAFDKDALNLPALTLNKEEHVVPSSNGYVTYSIANDHNRMFAIGSESGKISLVRQLDRESRKEWVMNIVATDNGSPIPKQSSCEITIKVEDVNDNRPFFVNPAMNNSLIYSRSTNNQLITKLRAVDYDEGINANLIYSIRSIGDMIQTSSTDQYTEYSNMINNDFAQNEFTISQTTGELYIGDNGASLGMKQLGIEVCDSGVERLCSQILLRVLVTNAPGTQEESEGKLLMIAATLGVVALLLTMSIPLIIVICRKRNKKIKSFANKDESNRYDVITDVISTSKHGSSFCSGKSEIKYTFVDVNQKRNSSHESHHHTCDITRGVSTLSINSFKNNILKNARCSMSDGDSGKGDSEPDSFESALCDAMQDRQRLSSTCSLTCLTYGHSDSCWMPNNSETASCIDPPVPAASDKKYYVPKSPKNSKTKPKLLRCKQSVINKRSLNAVDEVDETNAEYLVHHV